MPHDPNGNFSAREWDDGNMQTQLSSLTAWRRRHTSRESTLLIIVTFTGPINGQAKQLTATPGAYRVAGRILYAGIEAQPPNEPAIQYYDSETRRIGTLEDISGHQYRTADAPHITFVLDSPAPPVAEKPFLVEDGPTRLDVSLWHAPGAPRRSTIVLIHGADDDTRAMGFLIPYFVSYGLNVVTYDQRGTGESTGNWRYTSPEFQGRRRPRHSPNNQNRSDGGRASHWGFSNGGWAAPVVARRFPARVHDSEECAQ